MNKEDMLAGLKEALAAAPTEPAGEVVVPEFRSPTVFVPDFARPLDEEFDG
jgi:hypothetical protein